jgi:carbamoyltransferase
MKDILNDKVKNREWYRPFAPVCKLEDVSKYFNFEGESKWMGFCPTVKEEWREKLVSITHVDGTARVQTVTEEQNPWIYNLLTEFEKESGIGVLLNTSFNINGKPILSRYSDAMWVYDKTEMDCLVLADYYFRKRI